MSMAIITLSSNDFVELIPFTNESGRNDRFEYAKVRVGDEWFFRKSAKTPELCDNLEREVLWSEFVSQATQDDKPVALFAPTIIGFDKEGALLSKFIDAPLVCSPKNAEPWLAQLDRYAAMLVVLDTAAQATTLRWPDANQLNGIQNIDDAWSRWLGPYAKEVPQLEESKQYIKSAIPHLSLCVQHGDLTPWQMFADGEKWIIFDGEKAGDHLPRFNDLCYAYGRLYTRFHEHDAARTLLRLCIEKTNIKTTDFASQLLPVMLFRTVGMIGDAVHDKNKQALNDALDLYRRCLTQTLSALL